MIVYGVKDTMRELENKSIDTILCYENLDIYRILRKNPNTSEESVIFVSSKEINNTE